jgi:hypothetical protein
VEEDISHMESSANSSSSSKRHKPVKLKPVKNLDPIMLAPLGRHVFTFERPNGTHGHFNVDTLVDYLISTGDFYDPETRIPFSDTDLQAIDSLAVQAGFSKESVHAAKLDVNKYKDAIFVRDALQGLERCAGEVITEILNVIEECDPEEAQLRLIISGMCLHVTIPMYLCIYASMYLCKFVLSMYTFRICTIQLVAIFLHLNA